MLQEEVHWIFECKFYLDYIMQILAIFAQKSKISIFLRRDNRFLKKYERNE